MKKAVWVGMTALLTSSCGPAENDGGQVTPVAGELTSQLETAQLTVACSGESCRDFKAVEQPRTQQALSSLSYSTYLGFAGLDQGGPVAVDSSGNAYLLGVTDSFGGSSIFVAKMSPTGQNLYFTHFPGTGNADLAVDSAGNAYIAAHVPSQSGSFVAKLNPSGSAFVYYATVPWDLKSIAVDAQGNAYIAGSYYFNSTLGSEVVVGKLNASGSAFVYSVSFGGTSFDQAHSIAVDSSGNAYAVGQTRSSNFPTWNAFQSTFPGGPTSGFVAKLNAAGTGLMYSTYLGSQGYSTVAVDIALDGARNAYVAGGTETNFPVTPGAAQTSMGGGTGDGFVARLNGSGGLAYATYLGGSSGEEIDGIAVDSSSGTAYVTGYTSSSNFPVTSPAFQSIKRGSTDAFVTQVSPSGGSFWYSSYLGGSAVDSAGGIALDSSLNVYVSGHTLSSDFPTTVYGYSGGYDAFITRFSGP